MGIMSGTSLDGIDISIVKTDGHILFNQGINFTVDYDMKTLTYIKKTISTQEAFQKKYILKELNEILTNNYILAITKGIKIFKFKLDFISIHGQTVFHSAKKKVCN